MSAASMIREAGARLVRRPPLWREGGRTSLELAALLRSAIHADPPRAPMAGAPVLLIPGFLAGDNSLGVMTEWLRRAGYRTSRAGIRMNVNCSGRAYAILEERLERLADRQGQRVSIIGQSRGGCFAKALAYRRPDLVTGIVTLGSPQVEPLAVHPLVLAQVGIVGLLGTLGVPGLLRHSCLSGECCAEFRESATAELRDDVGYMAIYSRSDGIVDWRSCLDPAARELVEVQTSHCGMAVSAVVYERVARALHYFAAPCAPSAAAEYPAAA
jgi:pimeloyl-ACP methyl ester carboxylesterase